MAIGDFNADGVPDVATTNVGREHGFDSAWDG
jgi:hypothetical protein